MNWLKRGLKFIGLVQSTILLSLFYFVVLAPVAIPYRLINGFKTKKTRKNSYWQPRQVDDIGGLWRQF